MLQGNDTDYGLAAAIWTNDLATAHTVARRSRPERSGSTITWDFDPALPFGGYKQSGLGRECGAHWYEHYTEQKALMIQL